MRLQTIVIFLLLSMKINDIETKKIDRILKNVGRRSIMAMSHGMRERMRLQQKIRDWMNAPEEEVEKVKMETAERLVNNFIEVSSFENENYLISKEWIASILHGKMTADICGMDAPISNYAFTKHIAKTAFQYKKVPENQKTPFKILETPKNVLQVQFEFKQKDKFNLDGNRVMEVTMNATFRHVEKLGLIYSIVNVKEGGACLERGDVGFSDEIGGLIDEIEDLKNHPNSEAVFNLLTPRAFKHTETDREKITEAWLLSLDSDSPRIEICHEGITEPVRYTKDQFLTWYDRFGLMWHPMYNSSYHNYTNVQILKLQENFEIVARFTMKLQIGVIKDMMVHDWNFKMALKYNQRGDEKWYITHLEVLCSPTFSLKDHSFIHIRDVVTDGFLRTVDELPPPVPWYSTVEFVRRFTKHGHVEIEFCDTNNRTNLTQLEMILFHQDELKKATLTYYALDLEDMPLPATDLTFFRMFTLSKPINTRYTYIYKHEWMFTLKWDMMDQFFYVDKLHLNCPKLIFSDLSFATMRYYTRIYSVDTNDIPLPATDLTFFRMMTLSSPKTNVYKYVYEHEWMFTLKWDMMDQFYYLDKLRLNCPTLVFADSGLGQLRNWMRLGK